MKDFLRTHLEKVVPLTNDEFHYINSHFTPRKFKKHQFVLQEANLASHDFFVLKGLLKATYTNAAGQREHIIQFAWEDWWITDYQAYFHQTPATLSIDCLEDVEVLCLSLANRDKLCSELHKIEHFFRRKSNMGYVALQRRIMSLLTNSAKERYDQLFATYPQLFQRVPKTLLAAYLGVSRETLSRLSK